MAKSQKSNQDLIEQAKKEAAERQGKSPETGKPAENPGPLPAGSPVTAGTSGDDGEGGTAASENNQSLTPVSGATDTTPIREEDLPNVAADPGTSPEPTEPEDANVVADPDETPEQRAAREEFEKALNEPDVVETPSEAELDAVDPVTDDESTSGDHTASVVGDSRKNRNVTELLKLLRDKKDNFVIYGYGGVTITLGDLRHVAGQR